MGNCITKKKINHFENNELINSDEHLIHTMAKKIDDIYLKLTELNERLNEHEIDTSTNIEDMAKDIAKARENIDKTGRASGKGPNTKTTSTRRRLYGSDMDDLKDLMGDSIYDDDEEDDRRAKLREMALERRKAEEAARRALADAGVKRLHTQWCAGFPSLQEAYSSPC